MSPISAIWRARNFSLALGPVEVTVLARNYAETGPGELFLILGSSGYYEVSMSQGQRGEGGEVRGRSGHRIPGLVTAGGIEAPFNGRVTLRLLSIA